MATDNEVYTNYRSGLIQRHIAKNGRLLEGIWLVEDGGGISTPAWRLIRRSTEESLENGDSYLYNAYPLLITDHFYDQPWKFYLAGGGDNPLLMGGLAMAVFAIETILDVSTRSLSQARRLFDFAYSSQVMYRLGGPNGFLTRKRHIYHRSSQFSMDEICGMLVGLLFLKKATDKVGDENTKFGLSVLSSRLGNFLQTQQYWISTPTGSRSGEPVHGKGAEAFIFQYPFGKAFAEITDEEWQSDATTPEGWNPFFASTAIDIFNILRLDFNYTPRDLFEDVVGFYGGVFNVSQKNLYNATMVIYCILMIIESTSTNDNTRKSYAQLGNDVIKAISYDRGPFDGAKKPFRHNCLFSVVAKRCAEICGDSDSDWNDALDRNIALLREGDKVWFPNLPLGTPTDNTTTTRFRVRNEDGKFWWGSWYAWTANGTHDNNYSFMNHPAWNLQDTVNHIGPNASRRTEISPLDLATLYSADFSRGLRVESSGIDFLFARILASYYNYLPKPVLQDGDPEYTTLPVDSPHSEGFLVNTATNELHDLSVGAERCHLGKILTENQRWYDSHWKASSVHHFNDCFFCLRAPQYQHAVDAPPIQPYVANKRSNIIHSRGNANKRCLLEKISDRNILHYKTIEDAYKDGLNPCSFCIDTSNH